MTMPKCWGKKWDECNEDCSFEYSCKLSYQETVAIPRLNKEMDKAGWDREWAKIVSVNKFGDQQ